MERSRGNYLVAVAVCLLLLANFSQGIKNQWRVTDPRCSGGARTSYRLRRGVTTNNSGYYWKFNGNTGSCEMQYGSPIRDKTLFESQNECDRACLNVYHA